MVFNHPKKIICIMNHAFERAFLIVFLVFAGRKRAS